ncbi:MAG TPA: DNA mismatch repair endonuclease MutL [Blastocatellia bacterium]|jgi:DNA mismatch repair protein MutL|nr:DNA mismatch repair endonuclease MutL [Blastocatellia bacterium]
MSKIKVLPDSLANKIAAGEVVERPSSVVKELLENSLDAGARKIDVEVEAGGKRLIRIVDDGEGMTRDDALLAFERHATSKLRTVEDLESITTLGFRGEALPSIAAVSRLFLRTKVERDVEGSEVEFNGGRLVAVRNVAWPGGTEIEIKDLFFNMPARRKFLKSDATESFHITNLVQHYALANPQLAFLLVNNGREAIRVAPVRSLKERAYQVLGGPLLNKLVEVKHELDGLKIFGYVSNPQEQRSSRDAQYLFVNHRFVRDQLIGRALSEAYRSMMPSGTHPAAVLFVEVPPGEVDVNVHPAKTEVRFLREGQIISFIRNAVADALKATQPITQLPGINARAGTPREDAGAPRPWTESIQRQQASPTPLNTPQPPPAREQPPPSIFSSPDASPAGLPVAPRKPLEEPGFFPPIFEAGNEVPGEGPSGPEAREALPSERESGEPAAEGPSEPREQMLLESRTLPDMGHGIKPLGQIRDSYIVATDDEGLLLVDQHVAHERVLFEQFRDLKLSGASRIQPLLIPATLDLSPAEADAFSVVQGELEGMGIEASQLSGRTIAIKTAPAGISSSDVIALIKEVLGVVERERRSFSMESIRNSIAASLACKAAIKINMPLTPEKMQWLIDELMKTDNPMTCPHGRPIIMRYGLRDIERGFKRPV